MTEIPRPLLLIVMDGYGINPRADANAVALARKPNLDAHRARLATHPARHLWPGRRAAGGADGQLRGRPPEHRRGQARLAGVHARQRRHPRRLVLRESRAAERHRARQTQWLEAAPLRADRRWRRPRAPKPPGRLPAARGEVRGRARLHPRLHRRARHLALRRARVHDGAAGAGAARSAASIRRASPPSPDATTRWTATTAGSASRASTGR